MLTSDTDTRVAVSPDSDDWVPAWWGSDEENAREAEAFSKWTRSIGTDQ